MLREGRLLKAPEAMCCGVARYARTPRVYFNLAVVAQPRSDAKKQHPTSDIKSGADIMSAPIPSPPLLLYKLSIVMIVAQIIGAMSWYSPFSLQWGPKHLPKVA